MDDNMENVDDNLHKNLLKSVGSTRKLDIRREIGSTNDISTASSVTDDISLGKLVSNSGSVKNKKNVAQDLVKGTAQKTLKPAPSTTVARAAERATDFSEVAKQVTEWEPIVKANRQSEKLSFPLDKEPLTHFATTKDLVARSSVNPSTLEQLVYATLKAASHDLPDEETGLTDKESKQLSKLNFNEAYERLKELRRHRILTEKQLARFRREKSIKSKKFQRLKTRYKMERLQREMNEKGLNATLRDRRIEERTTLRHRQTSKWDRQLAKFAKFDKSSRDDLESKRLMNKKLTSKQDDEMSIDESDDSHDEESEWQVVTSKGKSGKLSAIINSENCDSSGEESGSEKLVDDMETEKVIEFRKDFKDLTETELKTGDPGKKRNPYSSQLEINPNQFLTDIRKVQDEELFTSVDSSAIQEAFEDDELMEELEEAEEKGKEEVDQNIREFGWGGWFGPAGNVRERKPREEFHKSRLKQRTKKSMGYVVFNNVKNEALAEHQLSKADVPFGFGKPEAFESSLRQPIGPDFNTTASFKSLIQPRITKKVGVPIEPISKEARANDPTLTL